MKSRTRNYTRLCLRFAPCASSAGTDTELTPLCRCALGGLRWHPASGGATARGGAVRLSIHRCGGILLRRLREVAREHCIHRLHVIFKPFGKRRAEGLGNLGMAGSGSGAHCAHSLGHHVVFAEMARRAALKMGEHLGATESYMRLALKAQSQSRATVETLAAIKNPPVVFARQANINNGGQQQVNNGPAAQPQRARAGAPARIPEVRADELLEVSDGQRLDTRAAGETGIGDPVMAAVGEVNRTPDTRRARALGAEQ